MFTVMAHFLEVSNQNASESLRLSKSSNRIAALLDMPELHSEYALLSCLDDLLGAVYSLFFAIHCGYDCRNVALTPADVTAVSVRARDMGNCRVRTEGKWTAGCYFNSALFRLSSVYHRVLQIVVGANRERFDVLIRRTHEWFRSTQESDWTDAAVKKVNLEVNSLKHAPKGIFTGRNVALIDAVEATEEILTLLEAFNVAGRHPVNDPRRETRIAAIEHLVYEYANLMSSAFHSLNEAAPSRTHCDDAFLLGCRKLGDFLLADTRKYGDEVIALDYLPVRSPRLWRLPIWESTWRAPMNRQLTHITYTRVRDPQAWDHRKWVPKLEAEFRDAWKSFWGTVTDREFLEEYRRQINHCRNKQGFAEITF